MSLLSPRRHPPAIDPSCVVTSLREPSAFQREMFVNVERRADEPYVDEYIPPSDYALDHFGRHVPPSELIINAESTACEPFQHIVVASPQSSFTDRVVNALAEIPPQNEWTSTVAGNSGTHSSSYGIQQQAETTMPSHIPPERIAELVGNPTCAICLEGLAKRSLSITSCGHVFHRSCLNACDAASCPICRRTMSPPASPPIRDPPSPMIRTISGQDAIFAFISAQAPPTSRSEASGATGRDALRVKAPSPKSPPGPGSREGNLANPEQRHWPNGLRVKAPSPKRPPGPRSREGNLANLEQRHWYWPPHVNPPKSRPLLRSPTFPPISRESIAPLLPKAKGAAPGLNSRWHEWDFIAFSEQFL